MADITRAGEAVWKGSGKEGGGTLATRSGALVDVPYSASMRFGDTPGTNPEELIAAAHAGCFAMALAFRLSSAGHVPEELRASAEVAMVREGVDWRIEAVALRLRGRVPGISAEEFARLAVEAKSTCPVSQLLNARISLDARLD